MKFHAKLYFLILLAFVVIALTNPAGTADSLP